MKLTKQEALILRRKLIRVNSDLVELGLSKAVDFNRQYKRKLNMLNGVIAKAR